MKAPIQIAYTDPAFIACLHEAIGNQELVSNFDRLRGATLTTRKSQIEAMVDTATGKQHEDIKSFTEFVHDAIYMRLPSDAIESLRNQTVQSVSHGALTEKASS